MHNGIRTMNLVHLHTQKKTVLKVIMLSEIYQIQKGTNHIFLIRKIKI